MGTGLPFVSRPGTSGLVLCGLGGCGSAAAAGAADVVHQQLAQGGDGGLRQRGAEAVSSSSMVRSARSMLPPTTQASWSSRPRSRGGTKLSKKVKNGILSHIRGPPLQLVVVHQGVHQLVLGDLAQNFAMAEQQTLAVASGDAHVSSPGLAGAVDRSP